jgi:hypothetical protein
VLSAMSKGPGEIEKRTAELLAATRDRALTVAEIADHAFALNGRPATRAQRLSATRSAHRVIRRIKESDERASKFYAVARDEADAAAGERPPPPELPRRATYDAWAGILKGHDAARKAYEAAVAPWDAAFKASKSHQRAESLDAYVDQFGSWARVVRVGKDRICLEHEYWRATADKRGTLFFHPPDVPVRVWAVKIDPSGVHWFDAEVLKVTASNVMARYAGEIARLDRDKLWRWWAWWRGVMFVSSRTGRIAAELEEAWRERYGREAGAVPPAMRMPLDEARRLLGLKPDYSREDVITAFRRAVKKAHPDLGGTAEMFTKLVEARDRLLSALGTSAPPPKPPRYAPSGVTIVYGSGGSRRQRLGTTRRLPAT